MLLKWRVWNVESCKSGTELKENIYQLAIGCNWQKVAHFHFGLLMSAFRGEFYFDTCLMYALDPGSLACLVRSGSSMEGAEGCGRLPEFWDSLATLFNKLPPPPRPRVGTFFWGWDKLKLNLALYDAYCVLYQTYILVQVLTDILWIIT